jgi:hypothetical protein
MVRKVSEAAPSNNQLGGGNDGNSKSNKEGKDNEGNGDGNEGDKGRAATLANSNKDGVGARYSTIN